MRALLLATVIASGCAERAAPASPASPVTGSDADGDGIALADDLCPNEAEDVDAFEDHDGCVDADNDRDRIPDANDCCPNEAELYNGFEDEDGCPDRGCVIVRSPPHCITEPIYFQRNARGAESIYDHVIAAAVTLMQEARDDIQVLTLRGHRSSDERPEIALQRAVELRDRLVAAGVDARYLAPADAGVPSGTPERQRRVDIEITQQRTAWGEHDDVTCTPFGPWLRKLTDAEKRAACQPTSP